MQDYNELKVSFDIKLKIMMKSNKYNIINIKLQTKTRNTLIINIEE